MITINQIFDLYCPNFLSNHAWQEQIVTVRNVDKNWFRERYLSNDFTGFMPHSGKILLPHNHELFDSGARNEVVTPSLLPDIMMRLHDLSHVSALDVLNSNLYHKFYSEFKTDDNATGWYLLLTLLASEAFAVFSLDCVLMHRKPLSDYGCSLNTLTGHETLNKLDASEWRKLGLSRSSYTFLNALMRAYLLADFEELSGLYRAQNISSAVIGREIRQTVKQYYLAIDWVKSMGYSLHPKKFSAIRSEILQCLLDPDFQVKLCLEIVDHDDNIRLAKNQNVLEEVRAPLKVTALDFRFHSVSVFRPNQSILREVAKDDTQWYFFVGQLLSTKNFELYSYLSRNDLNGLIWGKNWTLLKNLFRLSETTHDSEKISHIFMHN